MQIQKINGQSLVTNKSRSKYRPSFGVLIKKTDAFEEANSFLGIQEAVTKTITNAYKKYKDLNQTFEFDRGSIKTNFGDVFGISSEYFATRSKTDLAESIDKLAEKSQVVNNISNYVRELNDAEQINIKFEKNTMENIDDVLFKQNLEGIDNYAVITEKIKDAAKSLSKIKNKEKYSLLLNFKNSKYGSINAKLVYVNNENIFSSFPLVLKENTKAIKKAVEDINQQQLLK